jgi:hypothetical protein
VAGAASCANAVGLNARQIKAAKKILIFQRKLKAPLLEGEAESDIMMDLLSRELTRVVQRWGMANKLAATQKRGKLILGIGQFTPLAIADVVDDLCRQMPPIQGAMLIWRFGFVMSGAAATFGFGDPIHLHQQGFSAVGDAAINRSQVTPFTNFSALRPVDFPAHHSHPPQLG